MITDFLKIDIPMSELQSALKVLRAFKECESTEEWLAVLFIAWSKLEQLEEFLAHRVEGTPLKEDTLEYLAQMQELNRPSPVTGDG
jgi:hypothetical protein